MKIYPYLSESIANTLERIRKQKGMSKSSLADFSDIERCYLRGIEKGKRKPTVNTIFCICGALQIDPIDFFKEVVLELEKLNKSSQ